MLSNFSFKSQFIIFFIFTLAGLNCLAAEPFRPAGNIVVVDKARKNLVLRRNGQKVAEFPAAFGLDPDSDKYRAHDCATPEGLYVITYKKNESRFHRFLGLSYPNLANAARGLARGVISRMEYIRIHQAIQKSGRVPCDTGLGCGIGIHGGGVFRYFGKAEETNWTEGCIALNNEDIEKVFHFCRSGDPVVIFNSRRNLCGIIRPFTRIQDLGENGMPVCANGICTYSMEIPTYLGRMNITLCEGKDYGRSLDVRVYQNGAREEPLLVLIDRNADGYISDLDRLSGPMANGRAPDETYTLIRKAVISSLSKGDFRGPT